jgi:hypothetical protein
MRDSGYIGPRRPQVGSIGKNLTLEAEAQQVLDELLSETLIPFALRVGKITKAIDAYTIHFYDSRIHTARISLTEGHSFSDLVRQAVLARVARMSGPLKNNSAKIKP